MSTKSILIVGDLIIDQTWLVGEPDSSEQFIAHYGILPRNLLDPAKRVSVAGGIGTIARALAATIKDDHIIKVYGSWGKDFENSKELFLPPDPNAKIAEKIMFVRMGECKSDISPLISRIYVLGIRGAKLKYRFDQDVRFEKLATNFSNISWPEPEDISLLILADHGYGLLSEPSVQETIKTYKDKLIILRSCTQDLIEEELPWTILTLNL